MELVLNYIIDNVFKNTPVLMALIVAFGMVLNKKRWDEVLKGAFLAAIGMTIINLAVDILIGAVVPDALCRFDSHAHHRRYSVYGGV